MAAVVVWIGGITGVVAIAVAIFKAGMWANDVNRDRWELKESVRALLAAHRDVLVTLYTQNPPPLANPTGHSEAPQKELLLQKLERGTISCEEALQLRVILEEERKQATGMASVAIGGLLALLRVIIETSQKSETKVRGG